jgi:hypothetical protein
LISDQSILRSVFRSSAIFAAYRFAYFDAIGPTVATQFGSLVCCSLRWLDVKHQLFQHYLGKSHWIRWSEGLCHKGFDGRGYLDCC